MLDTPYVFKDPAYKRGDYLLECATEDTWNSKPNKVLIILETVDAQDLRAGRLLVDRSQTVVQNLFSYAFDQIKWAAQNVSTGKENPKWFPTTKDLPFPEHTRKHTSLSAVNFNHRKFFGEGKEVQEAARQSALRRINLIIDDLKPTVVIAFGDNCARLLLTPLKIEATAKKRGWVFKTKTPGGHKYKLVPSLDLYNLYTTKDQQKARAAAGADESEDEDAGDEKYNLTNLLFYVTDHVQNALMGRMRFDLSKMKSTVVYVDTISKFKKMWAELVEAKIVAVDTETKNLSVNNNHVNTIQFSMDGKTGYVVPMRHPESPFSAKEQAYLERKMRKFFFARPDDYAIKFLVFQNGKYDLRVLRREYKIPVVHHAVWELMAGEWLLDENRSALVAFGTPHGNLNQIFQVYGNDHYERANFGKEDRANSELTRLTNPDFLEYAAMDVISIWNMVRMQLERSAYLRLGDKSFRPYFRRAMLTQMSNTVHVLSHMKQYGAAVDKVYLKHLKGGDSPLLKLIGDFEKKMLKFEDVKVTNSELLRANSTQKSHGGLFGQESLIFSFRTAQHRIKLFFETMGLKPLEFTKEKQPKVDKNFIAHYRKEHPLVDEFGKLTKLKKLWSTYIKGWWNKLINDLDGRQDWRLRADYGFFDVVTGRLNCYDPNLQQVPSRGAEASYVKRAFRSPRGTLHIKFDYSAHEVRCWAYVSGDEVLASIFRVGQKLRQALRKAVSLADQEKLLKQLKRDGDIHILNIKFFFDKWVEKSDPLRDAIKAIVFGTIYGKGAKSLARDTGRSVDFAKDLIKRLFARFEKAGNWLEWSKGHAVQNYYTYSPFGFRRNLFGIMTGIRGAVASLQRKAANSPVQGLASQVGITVARLIALEVLETSIKFDLMDEEKDADLIAQVLKSVHDANFTETPYRFIVPMLHIMQYVATYGVTEYYEKELKVKFEVEPEIEIEMGATEDAHYKWDWRNSSLRQILDATLEDQIKLGDITKADLKGIRDEIEAPLLNRKFKKYLDTHYPILGLPTHGLELWTAIPNRSKD